MVYSVTSGDFFFLACFGRLFINVPFKFIIAFHPLSYSSEAWSLISQTEKEKERIKKISKSNLRNVRRDEEKIERKYNQALEYNQFGMPALIFQFNLIVGSCLTESIKDAHRCFSPFIDSFKGKVKTLEFPVTDNAWPHLTALSKYLKKSSNSHNLLTTPTNILYP